MIIRLLFTLLTFTISTLAQDAVLIFGYNNTRVYDVKKIRTITKENLNALTVLCKKSPADEDFKSVDFVIDTALGLDEPQANKVIQECKALNLNIIAVLPFSDQGTQLGALVAKKLNLPGNNPEQISAALDKSAFRTQEAQASSKPESYRCVWSNIITSKDQLLEVFKDHSNGLFIKPCQEGNNRGCTSILDISDCDRAWHVVEKYASEGILVEELIDEAQEYSCDNIGNISWLTLKETSKGKSGKYRGEIQGVVPAPLSEIETAKRLAAGRFMANICGYQVGAYHNEIFCKGSEIMAVEPNLRPGGLRIWDLAKLAFDQFDPWLSWINLMAGYPQEKDMVLKRNYYAGYRYISAPKSGIIEYLPDLEKPSQILDVVWTKKVGDYVVDDQRDNSDFIGMVIAKDKDFAVLDSVIKEFTNRLTDNVIVKKNKRHLE